MLAIAAFAGVAPADAVSDAADGVLAAIEAKDLAALQRIADATKPDPWSVASQLLRRGKGAEALAFAEISPRKDTEKLAGYVKSASSWRRAADWAPVGEARAAIDAGEPERALAALDRSDCGDDPLAAFTVDGLRVAALVQAGRKTEAEAPLLRALETGRTLGCYARVAAFGQLYVDLAPDPQEKSRRMRWRLELEDLRGNVPAVVTILTQLGMQSSVLRQDEEALACFERCLKLLETFDQPESQAMCWFGVACIRDRQGRWVAAKDCYERAARLAPRLRSPGISALIHGDTGIFLSSVGDYRGARDHLERALAIRRSAGDEAAVVDALCNLGQIQSHLGDYSAALRNLELAERKTKDGPPNPRVLVGLGNVHQLLGDDESAEERYRAALELARRSGDRSTESAVLHNLAAVLKRRDVSAARALYEQSVRLSRELGDRQGAATSLESIASLVSEGGDAAAALELFREVLAIRSETGDERAKAPTMLFLASALRGLGRLDEAEEWIDRAIRLAEEAGDVETRIGGLADLMRVQLLRGAPAEAVKSGERALRLAFDVVRGLAEEEGARALDEYQRIVGRGVAAARESGDIAAAWRFVESGRALALRSALGGGDAIRELRLAPELLREEEDARLAEAEASRACRDAVDSGDRERVRTAGADLERARSRREAIAVRIQREASDAASLRRPADVPTGELRGWLREDEAFVEYSLVSESAVAFVVTRAGARLCVLSGSEEIRYAVRAVEEAGAEAWSGAAPKLAALLVEPLGLEQGIRRLIVSPQDRLAQVPFALIAGDREIAYVPSASVHGTLLPETRHRGAKVLAVGDPGGGAARDSVDVVVMRGGREPTPLPAAAAEARAVGDTTLLGRDATEKRFSEALAGQPRWRAVHFACHGLVNADRPMLSSLALCPDPGNDGFLSVLDVLRLRIPADLVVLSACETARGRVYRSEGVVGFVRAFMFAGAPRVIVSLWKVDDDATKALMVNFHESWKGGTPCARALLESQRFVASREKWKDPQFWAAWQLWGLPE
jgi:tetratricopeptide (TPR) repeat protein